MMNFVIFSLRTKASQALEDVILTSVRLEIFGFLEEKPMFESDLHEVKLDIAVLNCMKSYKSTRSVINHFRSALMY